MIGWRIRDLGQRYGSLEAAWQLPAEQRLRELFALADRYRQEFAQHGLERVQIS